MGTRQGTPGFHTLGNGRQIHRETKHAKEGKPAKIIANVRGRILETAYPVTERNGCLFIETGFRIQFTYDKKTDRITLMPGGEYKRVTNPENKR